MRPGRTMELLKRYWAGAAFTLLLVGAFVVFAETDLFELWYDFSRQHEQWDLDEVPIALGLAGVWGLVVAALYARREAKLQLVARERAEALTSGSLRQFLEAMESCPIGMVFFDSEGRLVLINESLRKLGADGNRFALGRTFADLCELAADENADGVEELALFREIVSRDVDPSGINEAAFGGRDYQVRKTRTADGGYLIVVEDVTDRKRAEELLRDRIQFQRALFQAVPVPIFFKDENGVFTGCNPAYEEMMGRGEQKLIGRTVFDIVPTEDASRFDEIDQALLKTGGQQVYEARISTEQGDHRDVKFSKAAFTRSDGSYAGVIGVILDLTEAKRSEKELRRSEARLRAILDNSPASIYLKDTEGRFLLVNREFERRNGLKAEQVLNRTSAGLIPDSSAEIVMGEDRRVLETRLAETFQRQLAYQNGYLGTFLTTKFPVMDEHGELIGVGSVSTDVTERTKAVQAVRETAGQLQSIIEHSPAAILLRDTEGRLLVANKQYLNWHDMPDLEQVRGKTAGEYQSEDAAKTAIAQDREVIDARESRVYDLVWTKPGGPARHIHLTKFPVYDLDGGLSGTGTIGTDITDLKRAEAAAQRLQSELAHTSRMGIMGEMAAGFAHELNQPLAAIKNYVTGVLRRFRSGDVDAEVFVPVLELVIDQAQRASEVIRRIRRFVRKGQSEKTPTDVNDAVATAAAMLDAEIDLDVSLRKDLAANLPLARADAIQIQQVVLNLLRNAIEAVQEIDGQKEIIARTRSEGRFLVRITIEDTGPGIADEVRKRLFEPFFTTKPSGMGIGLLICRTILEEHGSRLDIGPSPSGGTSVSFCLPVAEEAVPDDE